ncbi:TetR/AcrR family transcriptional regulator [Mycobacterium sp. 21AC1]|uniref:TetR/AcrR family transcriptional regulator n=1 Tax=[Mycobacterium] appelbergii TaxID=2939269 RepID=UPI002938FF84|nr:TetR/AcrR family transcriptional regulator [Mycobacterium sp. 21AC1]MDV3129111.1 TetR/AcrR family transcriptional regulator [Mycobacterium sp. 21AC1]
MPRVIKHPDIRRAELLDRALALFLRHGFENVSLNDLIADAGVSKGAFYHWFQSKEALIVALTDRIVRDQYVLTEAAIAHCSGNALDKLNTLLQCGFDAKVATGTPEQLAATVSLLRPENAHLYARIVALGDDLTRPLLTRLITDGVTEGTFDTFDPEGVADMLQAFAARTNTNLLRVADAPSEADRSHEIDVLTTRFRLHSLAIDRILGLPDGSVTILTRKQVETMAAALPRDY